jgi:hypothetical protein
MENYNLEQDVFNWLEAAGFEQDNPTMHETAINGFWSEIGETMLAYNQSNKSEVLDGVVDSYWMLQNMRFFGIDIRTRIFCKSELYNTEYFCNFGHTAFTDSEIRRYQKAVSISNWSKFCKDEAEARLTVFAYENGTHPDKLGKTIRASHKQVNDKWVVFDSATRKVLKSINYQPVQEVLKTL